VIGGNLVSVSVLVGACLLLSSSVVALFMLIVVDEHGPLRSALTRYSARIDRDLLFLRRPPTGTRVIVLQALALIGVAALAIFTIPTFWVLLPLVVAAPVVWLKTERSERVHRIEQQLDGWLLVLANALKAVPAIGDALSSSQALMHAPISEELDVALKEYRLGTPLDRALQSMADRVGSRVVRTAVTTLQVARRTGGNLPLTLESSASSLREMARLEGVVRTKTADGRNQAFVIGALPGVLIILLYFVHRELLMPLIETTAGNILLGLAIALWMGAVVLALRILKVDL
jgi:tight adherence protein B